uniref:Uncharacterized protein n=1 Tax=Rhizophora mucronata TaxID=61149 RepID=A0A2P2QXY1_RHIMU
MGTLLFTTSALFSKQFHDHTQKQILIFLLFSFNFAAARSIVNLNCLDFPLPLWYFHRKFAKPKCKILRIEIFPISFLFPV